MTAPCRNARCEPVLVSQQTCISRLIYEVQLLVAISLEMQTNIHSMDLVHTTTANRKVLQSADALSQRLECVKIALEGLAAPQLSENGVDLRTALGGIFLEDVRERLLTGVKEDVAKRAESAGRVDLL